MPLLSNRFEALAESIEDLPDYDFIESAWDDTKKVYNETCVEVLGKMKREDESWISENSYNLIEQRKDIKIQLCNNETNELKEEYRILSKRIKKSIRRDKRNHIEELASQAERAAERFDSKEVYNITKKLTKQKASSTSLIRDLNGNLLSATEDQQKRWVEHFSSVLNRPPPIVEADIPPADSELNINIDPPTEIEIRKCIGSLKNGKAAGPDNIPPEALKVSDESSAKILRKILLKVWETNKIPDEWKEGHLTVLPKKGDLTQCDNHRGIMLLSVPGKVTSKIILERLKLAVDEKLRKNQAGFRAGRSCADQIVTLRIIIEQCLEMRKPCFINFIDYQKAFDSLDRNAMWKILAHYGIPKKFIDLIKCMYDDQKVRVLFKGKLSAEFLVKTGVRQGCLLSPFLFLLAIDYILKNCTPGNGLTWTENEELDDLDFADDLAELSDTLDQIQNKTNEISQISSSIGLFINVNKTKTIRINADSNEPVKIGAESLEEVDSFTYLGSIVNKQAGSEEDILNRLKKARQSFGMLSKIWKSNSLSRKTKLRIFNSNVKSVLLYGSESWSLTQKLENKVQVFVNTSLRRILRIRWPETISNLELWRQTDQTPIISQIKKRKYKWIGHTLRRPTNEIQRQALTWNPPGTRRAGRPYLTWRRQVSKEIREKEKSWREIENLAQDRTEWRKFVLGLSPPDG